MTEEFKRLAEILDSLVASGEHRLFWSFYLVHDDVNADEHLAMLDEIVSAARDEQPQDGYTP